ncbi:hypothetical protein PHYBLDRAFT_165329 [Phycomyces blakesleeanus NRRL 1555(-)]|uniref:Uncharacterized protein n=1 Tax=Phycomyces blakesleeanus (strain ATCC 8743b / DSM 1359 / FGSC 10004 / NBRC 33097 / NRRL 1555) TaxID=763407 RepID=A0A167NXI4_PHYB8|nr:hypothetical protein PHYBLDRAFT_165329 [Phycomyces blakesleeanus NRRL 1555(-)]OAD76826.1 hypothetical protein PHYBLDRAFT_165329 [Phycomyces blakesleeanus NRRL 1555(-)]|eukprot:XP_018294866.1 hypothetical protein PHYBLDRAFT_165329 [Phycomyces blakesleeanus NRRL 1555(-)]
MPATFSYNNRLYTYGGQVPESSSSNTFSFISLSTEEDSKGQLIYETVLQNNPGPSCSYSQAVVLQDNHTALLFTGIDDNKQNDNETIRTYIYDLQSQGGSWKEIFTAIDAPGPNLRTYFTATLAPNGKAYIYGGGSINLASSFNDLWVFDPTSLEYVNLTQSSQICRYGHTATALPNGQIVFLFGSTSQFSGSIQTLISPNKVDIYDTNTNQWIHIINAVVTGYLVGPDKKTIFVFGGKNGSTSEDTEYYGDLFLLDTNIWMWSKLQTPNGPYYGRVGSSMGFIDTNLLAIAYGNFSFPSANDIDILYLTDKNYYQSNWIGGPEYLLSFVQKLQPHESMNGGTIAGITIGAILSATIIGFCIWKTFKDTYYLPNLLYNFIWEQRSGEPMWTEISRLIVQFVFTFLFLAYLVFSIQQALDSPTTSITMREKVSYVSVPDIRFCIEGLDMSAEPTSQEYDEFKYRISCITDKGTRCSEFVTMLDTSIHLPIFEDTIGRSTCYLFSPPSWLHLGYTDDGYSNGTKLQFTFNGNMETSVTIRITQYPPGMDPNIQVYGLEVSNVPLLMTNQAFEEWAIRDTEGKSDPNTFTLYTNEALVMQYQIKDHQYLEETGWNRIGFLPHYKHTPEISSLYVKNNFSMVREQFTTFDGEIFGSTTVYPIDYVTIIEQDQKMHTILNSLGSVGGILSLMVGIQAWLFGFRPKSPWGVVQRWSRGPMKRSLGRNLQTKFDTLDTPVPFVNPVNVRFADTDKVSNGQIDESKIMLLEDQKDEELRDLRDRLGLMEKRMQLTERLLETYYVNDEIFKELDLAIDCHKKRSSVVTVVEEASSNNDTLLRRRVTNTNLD